jgi:hypothetical protein
MKPSLALAAWTLLSLGLCSPSRPVTAVPPTADACNCLDLGLQGDQLMYCQQQMPGGCGLADGCYDLPADDTGEPLTVYVKFHIVYAVGALQPGGAPCTVPPDQAELGYMLGTLNDAMAPAQIQLVQLGEIHRFESAALHRITCESELASLLVQANEPHAVDVYWVDQLYPLTSPFCAGAGISICQSINGWGSLTTTSLGQGVVLRNCGSEAFYPCDCPPGLDPPTCDACPPDCGLERDKIFIHEMGHYFDLLHPHETTYGVGCTGTSEANCASCGDFVCDTWAEPQPSAYVAGPDCTGLDLPPPACGNAPYQVDLTNFMSQKEEGLPCRNHFTRQQLRRMRATLLNLRADELL